MPILWAWDRPVVTLPLWAQEGDLYEIHRHSIHIHSIGVVSVFLLKSLFWMYSYRSSIVYCCSIQTLCYLSQPDILHEWRHMLSLQGRDERILHVSTVLCGIKHLTHFGITICIPSHGGYWDGAQDTTWRVNDNFRLIQFDWLGKAFHPVPAWYFLCQIPCTLWTWDRSIHQPKMWIKMVSKQVSIGS